MHIAVNGFISKNFQARIQSFTETQTQGSETSLFWRPVPEGSAEILESERLVLAAEQAKPSPWLSPL